MSNVVVRYSMAHTDQQSKPVVIRYGARPYGEVSSIERYRAEEADTIQVTGFYQNENGEYVYWLRSYGLQNWSVFSPVPLTVEEIEQLP